MIASIPFKSTCSHPDRPLTNPPDSVLAEQAQLIQRAKNGDLEAFNELVLKYQDRVFRQALWMLNDEAAAEDACQETFIRAYSKLHTMDGRPFLPWIMKITTNYCLDQIRRAKHRRCMPLMTVTVDGDEVEPAWVKDPGDSLETIVDRAQTGDILFRAIQKLTPEYRAVVILIDLQELDYSEASAILHIPLGTLKSRLARSRAKLRDALSVFCVADRMDRFATVHLNGPCM